MKRLFFLILVCVFMAGCSGCAGISIEGDTKAIAVKAASRVLGYKAADRYPDMTGPAKIVCQSLISGEIDQALIETSREYLLVKFKDDPLIAASVADLAGLIKIDGKYDNEMVKVAAGGFFEGVELWENTSNTRAVTSTN